MRLNPGKPLCLIALLIASSGCVSQPAMTSETPASPLSIALVLKDAQRLNEREVTIEGLYAGWWGKCQGGPPMSRSDWMIEDGKGACLYVHGPFPLGIERPPSRASMGQALKLKGKLRTSPQGQAYLALPSGE